MFSSVNGCDGADSGGGGGKSGGGSDPGADGGIGIGIDDRVVGVATNNN